LDDAGGGDVGFALSGPRHSFRKRVHYSRSTGFLKQKVWRRLNGHELGFEVWIGDPAEIKAKRVKKLKNGR
jgi:hypothetical protein